MSAHLMARWRDLFNANFDVLLYDLTPRRRRSRDNRHCRKAAPLPGYR